MNHHKSLALAFFFLQPFDFGIPELNDLATGEADHVVMMLMPQDVLVKDLSLATLKRRKEATFDQQAQGAIDRGSRSLATLLVGPGIHLFRGKVLVSTPDKQQHLAPLLSHAEIFPTQKLFESSQR